MGRKRFVAPQPAAASASESADDNLTPYEMERQALIARNRKRMVELGVHLAAQELSAIASLPSQKASKPKPRATSGEQPAKRSKRIKGEAAPASSLPDEAGDYEEDKKPQKERKKASRAPSSGGPRHPNLPAHYPGVQSIQLTEDEQRQQAELMAYNERMAAIQLQGLVDWTEEKAVFVVKGSRGDNYLVSITDEKNTCQCMDHRIRRRDCKHIKLIQSNLGLDRHPISWREAVHNKFMVTAEDRIKEGLQAIADAMGISNAAAAPVDENAGPPGTISEAAGGAPGTGEQGRKKKSIKGKGKSKGNGKGEAKV